MCGKDIAEGGEWTRVCWRGSPSCALLLACRGCQVIGAACMVRLVWRRMPRLQATIEKAFPSSSKCKRCHERVFEEWETSPLSRSIHSPTFRASLDAYLTSPAGKDKALCFRCHAPHVREFADHVQLFVIRPNPEIPRWMVWPARNVISSSRSIGRSSRRSRSTNSVARPCMGPYKDLPRTLRINRWSWGCFTSPISA